MRFSSTATLGLSATMLIILTSAIPMDLPRWESHNAPRLFGQLLNDADTSASASRPASRFKLDQDLNLQPGQESEDQAATGSAASGGRIETYREHYVPASTLPHVDPHRLAQYYGSHHQGYASGVQNGQLQRWQQESYGAGVALEGYAAQGGQQVRGSVGLGVGSARGKEMATVSSHADPSVAIQRLQQEAKELDWWGSVMFTVPNIERLPQVPGHGSFRYADNEYRRLVDAYIKLRMASHLTVPIRIDWVTTEWPNSLFFFPDSLRDRSLAKADSAAHSALQFEEDNLLGSFVLGDYTIVTFREGTRIKPRSLSRALYENEEATFNVLAYGPDIELSPNVYVGKAIAKLMFPEAKNQQPSKSMVKGRKHRTPA